uniref:FMN-binding negative transcriptional regulator n=1 Tax=Cellvibrio fontiphilus TaxID=1815559 RepID=UPI002B4C0D2C|nr:FMN-binding negative transcriptional regulator [Cellvibrio fontiphilus]
MYIPKHFAESDNNQLYEFIRSNPFALLVTNTETGLNADHLPVYLNTQNSRKVCVQGHIASANPLWKNILGLQEALLIFQGCNAYITPSWMPSKKTDGKVVPTWNYSAVHVKGRIEFIHEPCWKLELLNNLTTQQENELQHPWAVSDAPAEYIEKLLPAIVGFEVVVNEVVGKFKLSQNQSLENRAGIAKGLKKQGHKMAEKIFQTLGRK